MSCCDEYGNCNQGRNCPIRNTPAEAGNYYPDTKPDVFEVIYGYVITVLALIGAIVVLAVVAGFISRRYF